MLKYLLAFIPGVGPALGVASVAWQLITSPVGKVALGVLGAGALYVAGDIHGHNKVMEKWRDANAQAIVLQRKRDADIKAWAASQVQSAQEGFTKQTADLQQKVDEYEKELAAKPAPSSKVGTVDACLLDSRDVKRLRGIK